MSELARMLRDAANKPIEPHQTGVGSLSDLFDEEPVDLETFIKDKKYLGNDFMLSPPQLEVVKHIERIYYDGTYINPDGSRGYDASKDLYTKMAAEFSPYWEERVRMTNISVLLWAKGCISGNTDIYNAQTGQWIPVKDLERGVLVQGVDAVNPDGGTDHKAYERSYMEGKGRKTAPIEGVPFKRGEGRMLRVHNELGGFIDVYEGHLFSGWGGEKFVWLPAGDLVEGDQIVVAAKLDCAAPITIDPREPELVGYWIGDGSMPVANSAQWGFYVDQENVELTDRYCSLVESYEGIIAHKEIMPSGCYRIRATGSQKIEVSCVHPDTVHSKSTTVLKRGLCNIHYQREKKNGTLDRWPKTGIQAERYLLIELIQKYGLYGSRAWDKRVPKELFSLNDDQLAILMSALFDTDGSIYFGSSGAPYLEYSTTSEGLANDVQRLLLRFGVVSRIRSKIPTYTYKDEKKNGRRAYLVCIDTLAHVQELLSRLVLHGEREIRRHQALEYTPKVETSLSKSLSEFITVKIKKIEELGHGDYWDLYIPKMGSYIAGQNGTINSNSGKDHVGRLSALRVAYLLMCLKDPLAYFGKPSQDSIHMLNVAAAAKQARDAFFDPMKKMVGRKGGWFEHRSMAGNNVITFDKNIQAFSGHSDAETQEGLNLIFGIADEVDAFKSVETIRKGGAQPVNSIEGILKMLRTSGSTRFPQTYKNLYMSYPRFKGSPIMQLTKRAWRDVEAKGENSRYFVSGPAATWDINPSVPGPQYYQDDYDEDPASARAAYECRPELATNAYFSNSDEVEACFTDNEQPVKVNKYQLLNGRNWAPVYEFSKDFVPIAGAYYAMHGDLAVTGDRAGIAMSHVSSWDEVETFDTGENNEPVSFLEPRPTIKVDFVISFSADKTTAPPREIQIRWARQLAFELIKRGFNISLFTFDKFECLSGDTKIPLLDGTVKTMQELEGSEPFWLYSVKDGRVVPGLCTKAWKTSFRNDMLEVVLDNGESIKCTSDHRFMLRDGSYKQALLLEAGESLMPLYRRQRKVSSSSPYYEQIYHPDPDGSGKHWRFTHSMVSHEIYGKLPKGWVTHHMDINPLNNSPENLKQMTSEDHTAWHQSRAGSIFKELWADPAWREEHKKRISQSRKNDVGTKLGEKSNRYRNISFQDIKRVVNYFVENNIVPIRQDIEKHLGCSQGILYTRVRSAGYPSWKALKDEFFPPSYGALATRKSRNNNFNNHKVVEIRKIPGEWVYDLQVEDHYNFATSAGVFVHNSRDSMQLLEEKAIKSKRVSADISVVPYKTLKDLMSEGRVIIQREPLAMREILSLNLLRNGRIDHGQGGSKDLSDAIACSIMGALELGGQENEDGERSYYGEATFDVGSPTVVDVPYGFDTNMMNWDSKNPKFHDDDWS